MLRHFIKNNSLEFYKKNDKIKYEGKISNLLGYDNT